MLPKPTLMRLYKRGIRDVQVIGRVACKTHNGHWLIKPCLVLHMDNIAGVEDHVWLNRYAVRALPNMPVGDVIAFTARMNEIFLLSGRKSIRLENATLISNPCISEHLLSTPNRYALDILRQIA